MFSNIYRGKKILLTGSNGFIGSNLLQYLSKNNKVYTIIRKKSKNTYKNKNITQIYQKMIIFKM